MRCGIALGIALLSISTVSVAQSSALTEEQTIRQLTEEIQELQQRVKLLESKENKDSNPSNTVNTKDPNSEIAPVSSDTLPTQMKDLHDLRGIQWRGFGEADYKVLNQKIPELATNGFVPGSAGGFYTGDLDLLLTSKITEKSDFLAEMVIAEGDAQSFSIGLDRVLYKYDYNDHFRTSFGRYHTGIGYYNQAFHSGKWLQTMADRPLIMQFADEGGILPTQAVGMSFTGEIPSRGLGLNYVLEYGSSDTIRAAIDGSDRLIDENNGNHIDVGIFFRPDRVPGLQIGGSAYPNSNSM
jgi:hypothetical protein